MKYFDTHAHYNDKAFDDNREEILNKCRNENVEYIVNVGASVKESLECINLANKYEYIYSAIGIHPYSAKEEKVQELYDMYHKEDNHKIVAVGEIGLDYHIQKEDAADQKRCFLEQIELANALKLPILIHTRDASLDTYKILKDEKRSEYGTLLHCFNPTDDLVRLVLERGYTVAFGGNITYKRAPSFKGYLEKIPLSQIVVETDAPYLAPVPVRGTINDSTNLKYVCKKLAEYKEIDEATVVESVYNNAVKFYNIK